MNSLIDFLTEHNIEHRLYGEHHHATRGRVQTDCPFCSPASNRFRLSIALTNDRRVHCWTCGWHSFPDTIREMIGCTDSQSREIAADLRSATETTNASKSVAKRGRTQTPRGIGQLRRPHRRYLQHRGFDPDVIVYRYNIQAFTLHPEYAWRLWIPVEHQGRIVSWTTRAIIDEVKRRYISASNELSEIPLSRLLYAEDHCNQSTVIIHEGPVDVWRTGPGSVALFGSVWTQEQIDKLSRYAVRVVCLDSDNDGQRRAARLLELLEPFPGSTFNVRLETGKDSASAHEDEVELLRRRFLE